MEEILERLNRAYTDPKFHYDDPSHTYTYDNTIFTSVTTYLQQFHKPFDKIGKSLKKSIELGISQEEVLDMWDKENKKSTDLGSAVHLYIENYYNLIPQLLPLDPNIIDRINKFNNLYVSHLYKLKPLKFETKIFSLRWKIAGTIDALFYNDKGDVFILDWKTNKKFTKDEDCLHYYEKLLHPFSTNFKNHHNEYSIQLSLYALILEEEYNIPIRECYLVYIGKDQEASIHKVKNFRSELKTYLEDEMEQKLV